LLTPAASVVIDPLRKCCLIRFNPVAPIYLSKVERDEFSPPAEDKVKAIAQIIKCDTDELLARAGRVSSDLSDIKKRHPRVLAALLRTTKGLTVDASHPPRRRWKRLELTQRVAGLRKRTTESNLLLGGQVVSTGSV
jgi:hypothetical protein